MAVLSKFQPSPINTQTDLTMLANRGFADDMSACKRFKSFFIEVVEVSYTGIESMNALITAQ